MTGRNEQTWTVDQLQLKNAIEEYGATVYAAVTESMPVQYVEKQKKMKEAKQRLFKMLKLPTPRVEKLANY